MINYQKCCRLSFCRSINQLIVLALDEYWCLNVDKFKKSPVLINLCIKIRCVSFKAPEKKFCQSNVFLSNITYLWQQLMFSAWVRFDPVWLTALAHFDSNNTMSWLVQCSAWHHVFQTASRPLQPIVRGALTKTQILKALMRWRVHVGRHHS